MPEEKMCTDVQASLDSLEHYYLENHLSRTQNYSVIYKALEKNDNLSSDEIQRLLAICVHDLKEDMQYAASIMYIIPAILSRVQMGKYDPHPDLLPSALGVIQLIKKIALLSKVESLKVICFDTLLSYPNETLIAAAEHNEEVLEIFNLYCQTVIPTEIRLQACSVLHKLLKILPPEKKKVFVEKGITVWFSKLIPIIMSHVSVASTNCDEAIEKFDENVEIIELLTDELAACDYSQNEMWHSVLECICNAQKYPAVMKNLLQKGSGIWHRLWIVFIRLLKNQVTLLLGVIGTPINSMLPVVEAAFKMDVDNRCKAFACWNVLIDSFSTETNESNITKRIKLLIIPLKSNNAKAEATALAKFRCWWHLITKFQNKIDKFLDNILVSFLNFCFGRHNATDKSVLIPGQISVAVKKLCIQAIVDMVGHDNCDGCTHLPKLKGKLITTKNLVDNWNHWIYSLTSTIMMSANTDHGLTKQQMTCLWKSFLMTIGELPENNIRKDLFSEMLSILLRLVQECKSNSKLADIVFNALVLSLFDGDIRIKQLLKTRNDINGPLCKIVNILLDPSLKIAYQSYNFRDMVTKLKPVTNVVLDPVFSSPNLVIGCILNALSESDNALIIWTSLVESICESNYDVCAQILCDIMSWPLKTINSFTYDIKIPAMLWYTTNDVLYSKLMKTDAFDKAIAKFLFTTNETTYSSVYFKLSVTLSVIKHKLTEESFKGYEKEIKVLQILTNHIDSYQKFAPLFPILIDRVLAIISILITNVNETLTWNILVCVRIMVTVMTQACNQRTDVSAILAFVGSLLKSLDSLFKVEAYHKLLPVIVNDLILCTPFLSKQPLTKSMVHSVMITFSKIAENKSTLMKIKSIIDDIENDTIDLEKNQSFDKNEFPTPKTKVPKKAKKKETSIVNTVVENGEEYLVVKSNWKFNPRKLTENQKEKLQRKREDIPALYQDLSQSQDEFKLVSWKTDSQDTSNSSKSESKSFKSSNNETASDMLLNLPSSNVVPKILENFFSENMKKESPAHAKDSLSIDNNVNKMGAATPRNTKSPRMALKDRVFRNVRNLIEKSGGVQKENKDASEDLNKTENIIKTPIQSQSNDAANIVNSAPPLLSADRPSRVKRKPKKFDELQLLTAKKSRQSTQDFKSNDKSGRSDLVTTPLKTNSDKDVIIIEEVGSPTVSVYVEEEVNEPVDLQTFENQTISGVNEVIESNGNSQKDVSKINNAMDVIIEAQNIEVGHKEKHFTCLDLDISSDTDKNSEKSNDRTVESFNNIKDDGSINKKGEMSNDIKDGKSNNKEDETCSANSNGSSNNNKKGERVKDIKDDSSNNKKGEKSDDIQDAKSNIKEGETSNDNKNGRSNDKTSDKSNYIMDEKSISKKGGKCNDKKTESTNDNKDEKSNNKKIENSDDKKDEESNDKGDENSSEKQTSPSTIDLTDVLTPQQVSKNKGIEEQKSTTKKKKSRIEKELAIDTVEGHPFLKNQSEKRLTRKALETAGTVRRKSLAEKLNKSKLEANSVVRSEKKTKGKNKEGDSSHSSFTVDESQDKDSEIKDQTSFTEDIPYSDDVIESSQDSTITTISVKSTKKTKKVPIVTLQKMKLIVDKIECINESQSILDCVIASDSSPKAFQESKDDIELPVNKTAFEEKSQDDLTENMDTEPIEKELSDVILINDDVPAPLTISSSETEVGPETQEIADADTQPTDSKYFMDVDRADEMPNKSLTVAETTPNKTPSKENKLERLTNNKSISEKSVNPSNNTTITLSESACALLEKENGSSSPSPFRDEAKRKQDFLNNTLEISPIKNMSPERNKKSPSPETSSDYVVIKLTSPVHSNGEPFEKCGSPEVFTADKDSPDKRDQSPPRVEVTVINTSPSSSLSLKKNRPQVRSGGRAAQMLGLCVPDKLQTIMNPEKNESEEVKKTSASSTPARRNLRILYNSVSENTVPTSENDDSENFLKFRRSLPAVDSSPSVPILKRKLMDITDDATISPAGKRKRVSFHDPPVSTTISVQKYIEPGGLRSPQNSANKRLERQLRQQTPLKSPKRLDHAFKLDTVLTKAIESFSETEAISTPDDTQPFSLDETPVVEIVRASELNDTDPICPDLLDCKDPIDSIASELSSSAMKSLLVKELVGKVETVGDLAKMTELEVNRLCIKAPKVKVAKKVLSDYASKRIEKPLSDVMVKIDEAIFDEPMPDPELKGVDIEVQTDRNASSEMEVQTIETPTTATFVQTETTPTAHVFVQTDESGSKSTADIIKLCLEERPDFVEQVSVYLEESSIQQITDKLPFTAITDVLMKKVTPTNSKSLLNRILEEQWNNSPDDNRRSKELSLIKDFVCDRFESKDLIMFCSEVLKSVYDKPVYP